MTLPTIETLPDDPLFHILDFTGNLQNTEPVCKKWNAIQKLFSDL